MNPCLTCGKRVPMFRGMCRSCYNAARRDVRSGLTTWARLEAAGLALPAQTRQQRNDSNYNRILKPE